MAVPTKFSLFHRFFYWMFRKIYRCLCQLHPGVYISNFHHVHIGKDVIIGSGAKLIARNHKPKHIDGYRDWEDVYISDGCWIGANAVVLPGVRIGSNSVVGAGAVVIDDVPPYSLAVGNPARVIEGKYNPDGGKHE